MTGNGSFTTEFAKKTTRKLDESLFEAIKAVLPRGSSVIDLGAGMGLCQVSAGGRLGERIWRVSPRA